MVVEEVRRQEEAERSAKAVSLVKQGQWMRWEGLERRKLSWRELWEMEASNISFIIRATYDVLPSPKNLHQWYGEDPICALCPTPVTLKHILTGCKTSLIQGRYTWRHNQVLKSLAAALESKRNTTNSLPLRATNSITAPTFIREGQKKPNHLPTKPEAGQLAMARDWKMLVNIGQQLIFPPEIAATTLRPDLVLWSPSLKSVYITELTVPWENSTEEAYERKKLHYIELAADAQQRGWKLKSIWLKWDVEVLWLLLASDCWKTLAFMDRLCDRQLDQSQKQPKEAASGYGLSGRTIAGLKEHQHDPLTNPPTPYPTWEPRSQPSRRRRNKVCGQLYAWLREEDVPCLA